MPTDHCATSIDVLGSCQLGQQKLHAATLPCTILSLLNFIVSVLVALVGWRFQNDTVSGFQAHPTTIKVTVASQLAFMVACGIELGSQTNHSPSWAALLRAIIVLSALLLVASLASLVFPDALPSLGRRCLVGWPQNIHGETSHSIDKNATKSNEKKPSSSTIDQHG